MTFKDVAVLRILISYLLKSASIQDPSMAFISLANNLFCFCLEKNRIFVKFNIFVGSIS